MKIGGFLMIAGVIMIGTSGCEYHTWKAEALEGSSKEIAVEGMKEDTEEIVPPSVSAEEFNRLKEQLDQIQAQIEALNSITPGTPETPSLPEAPPSDSEGPAAGSPDLPDSGTPSDPETPEDPGSQTSPGEGVTTMEVVGHAPERDQQNVSTALDRIIIRFSEPVDPATVTASSLRLSYRVSHDRVSVPVVQVSVIPHPTLVNRIFKFEFGSLFLPGKTYRAVVEKDGIRAVSGHTLSADDSWEFTTSATEVADEASSDSRDATMLVWRGAFFDWDGDQAFELDALRSGLETETSWQEGAVHKVRGKIVSRFKKTGESAKPYHYRTYVTAVNYDSATLKRVTKSYAANAGDLHLISQCHSDGVLVADVDVHEAFGGAWGDDVSGRYLYFAILRDFRFDLGTSVGPEDLKVGTYLSNADHKPDANGQLHIKFYVDVNGPVNAFDCSFSVTVDIIGIDTTVWGAKWFDTNGILPSYGNGTYHLYRVLSFPFPLSSDGQFVGLAGYGYDQNIEGDVFEIDSLGGWASVGEVAENSVRVGVSGHVAGYRSIEPNTSNAEAETANRTKGYVFACRNDSICKVSNRTVEGNYNDDNFTTRWVTVGVN